MRAVSLINLASVRALESAVGAQIAPLRFRADIYFEGPKAWCEFEWLDQDIAAGSA